MAAAVPNRKDAELTPPPYEKVRADKTREAGDSLDGFWVANPDPVPVCHEVFDGVLGERPNQLDRLRKDVTPDDRALTESRLSASNVRPGRHMRLDPAPPDSVPAFH